MVGEHQGDRYRTKSIQRGNPGALLGFIPNRKPTDTTYRVYPTMLPSRKSRRGVCPVRLSARFKRALTTLVPGAVVAADTSSPLLLI
ncbi:hypothetical protein [Mycobacterium lentiflavum]|uniref:Uncharacterized protein n=1 Tax=Mycobacterium lentiflavum TaxID=141349 RepID=A0ABY3USX0_MYCLN|nr:hypothetical protein [Mycobacterium lentiflavum]ULP42701.1 hypothetical protein MJO58_01390 [Mycobacterium lentiflavum]